MRGKTIKNVSDRISLNWADFRRNPNGPAQYRFARGGISSNPNLIGGSYASGHLSDQIGTLPLDSNPTARLCRVHW
jgi:broad specificity phosphatase PhoE